LFLFEFEEFSVGIDEELLEVLLVDNDVQRIPEFTLR